MFDHKAARIEFLFVVYCCPDTQNWLNPVNGRYNFELRFLFRSLARRVLWVQDLIWIRVGLIDMTNSIICCFIN